MQSSQKQKHVGHAKHLLLTGPPCVGKTTLVQKICGKLRDTGIPVIGFYTQELRQEKQRVGFDIISLDGRQSPLARISSNIRGPKVGKYTVDVASFESLALPLLTTKGEETQICVVDEIGKMELFSDRFKRKVIDILDDRKCFILGTIPVKKGNGIPFVESVRSRSDVRVFDVSFLNRDSVLDELLQTIITITSARTN